MTSALPSACDGSATTCTMPSWSRRSMKHSPPRSRATSAQPQRVTVWPIRDSSIRPQKWVRIVTPGIGRAGARKAAYFTGSPDGWDNRGHRHDAHNPGSRGRRGMIATVRPLAALLAGAALLLMGAGLLGTLLAVRGRIEGYDDQVMGLVMSAYFAGFFLGTYAAPGLIQRIGHIRAFAFYSALCAATVLLYPVLVSPW